MTTTLHLAILLLGIYVTGSNSNYDGFYFFNAWFRRAGDEVCKVCYGDNDCLTLNQARCEFYTATTGVLFEDEGPQDPAQTETRTQVDLLMSSLVERASTTPAYNECIPMISEYTNCNKENVCLGCMSCKCSEEGRWRCRDAQRCRPDERLVVDHRALVFTLESLRGDGHPSFRLKRSVPTEATRIPHRITFEEVAEWMYEVKPTTDAHTTGAAATPNVNIGSMINYVIDNHGPDYVAFDEVLNNVGHGSKTKNITSEPDLEHDYMNLENINVVFNKVSEMNTADEIAENYDINITSTVVTDAGATTKSMENLSEVATDKIDDKKSLEGKTLNNITFDITNDIDELSAVNVMKRTVNIMKRDVSQLSLLENELISPDTTQAPTERSIVEQLHGGVYEPLNKIIKEKQQELEDLTKIREKLTEIINLNQTNELSVLINKSETIDNSNVTHAFYNVEIIPEMEYVIKRSNVNELDKCLMKLKRDIFIVMRDVALIQRLSGRNSIPENMKGLIRAMRHYIHKHDKTRSKEKSVDQNHDLRRNLGEHYDKDFLKKYLIDILQILDRDMPQRDALAPLSTKTRKIIRRILNENKMNDYSTLGLRLGDSNYNLTNDLKTIGVQWEGMTTKIANSSPWNRLHHMKMLQFILESDINKMNDALALIDFAHSRRMITLNDNVGNNELLRINVNLKSIHDKIEKIITYKNMNKKKEVTNIIHFISVNKDNKKETFLKQIRNLIKNSKKDIMNLLHKKVPKTEIVKELAKKKLNELTKRKLLEYENVMHKWQDNLGVNKRRKRSAFGIEFIEKRMRNILPKYLRGKLDPKIKSKRKSNKTNNNQNSQTIKPHRRRNKNHHRKITTAKSLASSGISSSPQP